MKLTLDNLRLYCREDGGCLLWKLGTNGAGYPQANIGGKPVMVRRYVFECLLGKRLGARRPTRTICEHRLCVSPDCLRASSHSDVLMRAYANGYRSVRLEYSGRLERAKKAGMAKLDESTVAEMRATCRGLSYAEVGRRYGIGAKAASRVMRGESWREYHRASSIFQWRGTLAVNDERAAA